MTKTNCGACHTCGTKLKSVLDDFEQHGVGADEEWCPKCGAFRRYTFHGWHGIGTSVEDRTPCPTTTEEDHDELTGRHICCQEADWYLWPPYDYVTTWSIGSDGEIDKVRFCPWCGRKLEEEAATLPHPDSCDLMDIIPEPVTNTRKRKGRRWASFHHADKMQTHTTVGGRGRVARLRDVEEER